MTTSMVYHRQDEADLKGVASFINLSKKTLPFQKSNVGSSGITFLPVDYDFPWVIKWQSRTQAEIEYLCTKFYERAFTDLSIPKMFFLISEELKSKLRKYFQKATIIPADIHVPSLIEYKDGNNLNALCKNGHFFNFSANELYKMFKNFGEVVGYDFLIANFDRFMPAGFFGNLNTQGQTNGGNIMAELLVPQSSNEKFGSPQLKHVHVIDNAPHFVSFFDITERKINEESSGSSDFVGFGDLLDEGSETESAAIKKETPTVTTTSSKSGDELREALHKDFEYFITASDKELPLLSQQIVIGIKNVCECESGKGIEIINEFFDDQTNRESMDNGLQEGMQKAQQQIKNSDLEKIINEVVGEIGDLLPTTRIVYEFILENLNISKKNNFNVECGEKQ